MENKIITWAEIYDRILELNIPDNKFYGIPRGGQVIAGLTGNAVDIIEECDIIIDDVRDSGRTAEKYKKYGKEIKFLFDKQTEDLPWLVFPWEHSNGRDFQDDILRVIERFDDPAREGLKETPRRVAKMYEQLLIVKEPKITIFDANDYDQMIIDRGISYYTLCEHHLLPFFGKVAIGYIPDKKIIGLSKLARIVDYFSKRLNTQEYFTQNIANYLQDKLKPLGVGVIVTGRHLCKEMRGIKSRGKMITSAMLGIFLKEQKVKEEFLML